MLLFSPAGRCNHQPAQNGSPAPLPSGSCQSAGPFIQMGHADGTVRNTPTLAPAWNFRRNLGAAATSRHGPRTLANLTHLFSHFFSFTIRQYWCCSFTLSQHGGLPPSPTRYIITRPATMPMIGSRPAHPCTASHYFSLDYFTVDR